MTDFQMLLPPFKESSDIPTEFIYFSNPDYARTFHNMLKNNNLNINIFLKT